MTERYTDISIQAYLDRLASAEPEPGGGSVAALAGALGAALLTMVTDLTLGREKFASVADDMTALRARAEAARRELEDLVTRDAEAYAAVAAAMKLPRETDAEKAEREEKLQLALRGAAEVPLQIVEEALAVGRLALPAAEKGNPHAVSDAGVAALLADAAAQSAALNVRVNLAWMADQEFKQEAEARLESALGEVARLRADVLALTYKTM